MSSYTGSIAPAPLTRCARSGYLSRFRASQSHEACSAIWLSQTQFVAVKIFVICLCFSLEGCPHISCACCVSGFLHAFCELLCVAIRPSTFRDTPLFSKVLWVAIQIRITSSDPVSHTTPVAPVTEIDEDSAYTDANDSLRVLLLHGKRQSVETNASGSVMACAEAEAPLLSLTDVAGGGMQVEDYLGDL